jgi:excisionase family DNA binding protein
MDKICIVKLRKNMDHTVEHGESFGSHGCEASTTSELPVPVSGRTRMQVVHDERYRSEINGAAMERTVGLTLTKQQMNTLGSNPHIMSLLNSKFTGGLETIEQQDEHLVIKFQFTSMIPLRLLKSSEVVQMLRIGKNCLSKLVREGKLKSYKIGKLRRFLIDDVLSYLHDNCAFTDLPSNSVAKVSHSGILERSSQEV